jgi:hypothetical protein
MTETRARLNACRCTDRVTIEALPFKESEMRDPSSTLVD